MRRYLSLICILSICLALAGCENVISKPEDNLKPPLATGDYEGVDEALEQAVGKDIVLKYPLSNNGRSAFCPHDLDGDGIQEVLAFYSENKEMAVPHINVLKRVKSNEWNSIQDIDTMGSEISEVAFSDMDGDGVDEILVGCSNYTTKANKMGIYRMEGGILVQRANEQYSSYVLCDIDSSGTENLVIALSDPSTKLSTVAIFGFKGSEFTNFGSVTLVIEIASNSNLTASKIEPNLPVVFIDGYLSPEQLATEVIYFDGKEYMGYFSSTSKFDQNVTARYIPLLSYDINHDGAIDIPYSIPVTAPPATQSSAVTQLIEWKTFNKRNNPTVFTAWYSISDGYYLTFDQNWINNITVSYDTELGMAMFSRYDKETKKVAGELLRIRKIDSSEWESTPPEKYIKVAQQGNNVWIARLSNPDSPLYLDEAALTERFKLIESGASYIL